MSLPAWLPAALTEPDLVKLEPLAWAAYQTSFKAGQLMPKFKIGAVSVERVPHVANPNREHTYWHAVTEGSPEHTRIKAIKERLERVPWLRPFIENWAQCLVWWEERYGSKHWNLWHQAAGHVVIVKETRTGYFLKTGYPVRVHDVASWVRRHETAKKNEPRLVKLNAA
ncbi:MAG: hypothetical protein NTW21_25190 [Verrucomicrobia bacterium]|nr:hypothetical protein [Verrucomicrobiota bacterium]